jgi:hypothetical protein
MQGLLGSCAVHRELNMWKLFQALSAVDCVPPIGYSHQFQYKATVCIPIHGVLLSRVAVASAML